jgi:hypothetical protein
LSKIREHAAVLAPGWARVALSQPVFTGTFRQYLAESVKEPADPWL